MKLRAHRAKMTQILHCYWLPEQARRRYDLAPSRLRAVSRKKYFPRSRTRRHIKKSFPCSVFGVLMDLDSVPVSPKIENLAKIQPFLPHAWSIRDWSISIGGLGRSKWGWVTRFWALIEGWVIKFWASQKGWVIIFMIQWFYDFTSIKMNYLLK